MLDKLDTPIRLVLGGIDKLFIKVPWNALSSKPVKIQIEGLKLVVQPLTTREEWKELVSRKNSIEILE